MEGAYQVPDILLERDWAIKMDLRHGKNRLLSYELMSCFIAYYHVPMDPEHSNCLSFVWNGSLYRFLTMCFGIKNAPFIFDRLGRTMIRYFNSLGIRIIIYLDDILVLGRSPKHCIRDAQFVVDTLLRLGFHFKIEKCVLEPSQEFFFLGFIWNTMSMQIHLPEEKLMTIRTLSQKSLDSAEVQISQLQVLMGVLSAARPAIPRSRARSRGIQRVILDNYKGTVQSAKMKVRLSNWAKEELVWWSKLQIKECCQTFRTIPIWKSVRLATDAMNYAIGSILDGRTFYMELNQGDSKKIIAHKEWLAYEQTILRNLDSIRNKVIKQIFNDLACFLT